MIRRVFLAFWVFALVACGDDGTGLEDIAGTYTLQTVDGGGLPAVLEETETTFLLEITAGSVTLNQDMTCSVITMFRVTEFGIVTTDTMTGVCTYTFNNGAITLTILASAETVSGSITGSTLTVTSEEGIVFIYEK